MSFLISSTGRLILFVCVLGMGLQEAWSQNIWFVSPVDGEVVRPGETIPIILGTDPALGTTIIELSGTQGSGYPFVEIAGPPFETSFTVPLRNVGPNTLLALGWAASPEDTTGYTTVTVQVIPAEPPVEIFFLGTEYSTMTIPLSSPGGILSRLSPMGRYSDGTTRALSHPSLGTTYSVSDPGVASVDEEGRITPLSPGVAIVTVQNGPTVAYAGIQVRDAATGRIPTVEVTDQVSIARSGFRFNPANNTYVQKITVTNLGSLPLAQPLLLVLDELSEGVRSTSRSTTRELAPLGRPYYGLKNDDGGRLLMPGHSAVADLSFINTTGVPITYTPRVYIAKGL